MALNLDDINYQIMLAESYLHNTKSRQDNSEGPNSLQIMEGKKTNENIFYGGNEWPNKINRPKSAPTILHSFTSTNKESQFDATLHKKAHSTHSPQKVTTSNFCRIEELHNLHTTSLRKRDKMKKDLDEFEITQCTFKPQISPGAIAILRKKDRVRTQFERGLKQTLNGLSIEKVTDRLHEDAEHRFAHQRWLEQRVEVARREQVQFSTISSVHHR